jgi:hypothetical protein
MRRKSDFMGALDDMFSDDDKKRLTAIKATKEIAISNGPTRVRTYFTPFLNCTNFITKNSSMTSPSS